ncbi:GNAT family N-acetyltransferase [Caenimonas aquaedulcis]|nr:GNAT family N-acetyltransferase [Caenimonas aquaedulcis]
MLGTHVFLDTYAPQGMRPPLAREVLEHFSVEATEAVLRTPGTVVLLAESAGHLVGYAQLDSGTAHDLVDVRPASEVVRLYVHERFTGQGIGKALLRRCEQQARSDGAQALWLTAWIGNPRALRFYAGRGYADCGATDYVFEDDHYENRVFVKSLDRAAQGVAP